MDWSVHLLLERRHLLQHFSSNQRAQRPVPPVTLLWTWCYHPPAKHNPGTLPRKPSVFLSSMRVSPYGSVNNSSLKSSEELPRLFIKALYLSGRRLAKWARAGTAAPVIKTKTAAPRLNIAQMISSTHVSIEPAVALETHPPSSASSSSITTTTNFFIKLSSTKQQTRGQQWSQLERTSTMLGGGRAG